MVRLSHKDILKVSVGDIVTDADREPYRIVRIDGYSRSANGLGVSFRAQHVDRPLECWSATLWEGYPASRWTPEKEAA